MAKSKNFTPNENYYYEDNDLYGLIEKKSKSVSGGNLYRKIEDKEAYIFYPYDIRYINTNVFYQQLLHLLTITNQQSIKAGFFLNLNTGDSEGQGNHWVSCALERDEQGNYHFTYMDPLQESVTNKQELPENVRVLLINLELLLNTNISLKEYEDQAIQEGVDCGPASVFNLFKKLEIIDASKEYNGKEVRKEHIEILGEVFAKKQAQNNPAPLYNPYKASKNKINFSKKKENFYSNKQTLATFDKIIHKINNTPQIVYSNNNILYYNFIKELKQNSELLSPEGLYKGIGATGQLIKGKGFTIDSVFKDCPADKIGLKTGYIITHVAKGNKWIDIRNIDVKEAIHLLRNSNTFTIINQFNQATVLSNQKVNPKVINAKYKIPQSFSRIGYIKRRWIELALEAAKERKKSQGVSEEEKKVYELLNKYNKNKTSNKSKYSGFNNEQKDTIKNLRKFMKKSLISGEKDKGKLKSSFKQMVSNLAGRKIAR